MPNELPKIELKIFHGLNHPLQRVPGNRKIRINKELLKSTSYWGNFMPVTIVKTNVYSDNPRKKELFIVDGQHRINIAESKGEDFYANIIDLDHKFMGEKKEVEKLVIDINTSGNKWNIDDFINKWEGEGDVTEIYKELRKIHLEYKPYSGTIINTATMLAGFFHRAGARKIGLYKGEFTIKDKTGVIKMFKFIREIYGFGKPNDRMRLALYKVMKESNWNEEKFKEKYKKNYKKLKDKGPDDYFKDFKKFIK
jgi:hypothetical protein